MYEMQAVCVPFQEKYGSQDDAWDFCQKSMVMEGQRNKTHAVCYEPRSYLGKLYLQINPDNAPHYFTWCDQVLMDFQGAVKLDGYL